MNKPTLALFFIATLLVTSVAFAQRPGGGEGGQRGMRGGPRGGGERPVSPLMMALDANKDGKLSAQEIADATTALKALDKNEDGSLDASELVRTRPERGSRGERGDRGSRGERGSRGGGQGDRNSDVSARVDRMFEKDSNKDGKISKEEGGESMSRWFQMVDTDGDKYISREEAETAVKRMSSQGGRRGGGGGYRGEQILSKDHRPAYDDE